MISFHLVYFKPIYIDIKYHHDRKKADTIHVRRYSKNAPF